MNFDRLVNTRNGNFISTKTNDVLNLPCINLPDIDYTQWLKKDKTDNTKLTKVQNQALWSLHNFGGLIGNIGVGAGKTLISMVAGHFVNADKTIILIPPGLKSTFYNEFAKWDKVFWLHKIELLTYSAISTNTNLLDKIADKNAKLLIVCDEAHYLASLNSARTIRFLRFVQAHSGNIKLAFLSGTLASKSILDFAHLCELALGRQSPLPSDVDDLKAWAHCIDDNGNDKLEPVLTQFVEPLLYWAKVPTNLPIKQQYAKAFHQRFVTCGGVVSNTELSSNIPLKIITLRQPPLPVNITNWLTHIRITQTDPNGEVFIDDSAQLRCERQLVSGFFYKWQWPNGIDIDWLTARNRWNSHVRAILRSEHATTGYDSPALIAAKVESEWLKHPERANNSDLFNAYSHWYWQKSKPVPPTQVVVIDTFLIDWVFNWLHTQKEPVLVWYQDRAVAIMLANKGIKVYFDGETIPEKQAHTCAVSITAHSTGYNLHAWNTMLVLYPRSSGKVWQQMLGRICRQGQKNAVTAYVMLHCDPFEKAFDKARSNALYLQQLTGTSQLLNTAMYQHNEG